jgi:hypothetical protein
VALDRDRAAHAFLRENVGSMLAIYRTKLDAVISGTWWTKVPYIETFLTRLLLCYWHIDAAGEVVEANIMLTGSGKSKGCGYGLFTFAVTY